MKAFRDKLFRLQTLSSLLARVVFYKCFSMVYNYYYQNNALANHSNQDYADLLQLLIILPHTWDNHISVLEQIYVLSPASRWISGPYKLTEFLFSSILVMLICIFTVTKTHLSLHKSRLLQIVSWYSEPKVVLLHFLINYFFTNHLQGLHLSNKCFITGARKKLKSEK